MRFPKCHIDDKSTLFLVETWHETGKDQVLEPHSIMIYDAV